MIYQIERYIYFALSFMILILPEIRAYDTVEKNQIITILLTAIILYHFIISRCRNRVNTIHSNRVFKKFYLPIQSERKLDKLKVDRSGDNIVIIIYFIYMFTCVILCKFQILISWNLILFWMLFLLGLNNVFKYKKCLIKEWVYKDTNCCMDCHINGWDDVLIFSILPCVLFVGEQIFAVNKILILIISIMALTGLVCWEGHLYFFPYRFFPQTNGTLACKNCIKTDCVGRMKYKFSPGNSVPTAEIAFPDKTLKGLYNSHYVVAVLLLSTILTLIELFLVGEDYFFRYYITFLVIGFEMNAWRLIYVWIRDKYNLLFHNHIDKIIEWDRLYGDTSEEIYNHFNKGMFEISSIRNIIIYTGALLFWLVLFLDIIIEDRLNLPENIGIGRMAAVFILMAYSLTVGCRAFVIFYNSYKQLSYISKLPVKENYYKNGFLHINEIKKFCNQGILIISLICLTLILAVVESPIEYSDNFKVFTFTALGLVALCPVIIYIGVQYYLKNIVDKMKEETIRDYNERVLGPILGNIGDVGNEKTVKEKIEFRNYLIRLKIRDRNKFDYTPIITVVSGGIQIAAIIATLIRS
ncbi:hypothetical protein HMPREF9473_02365 [ [Hungatella hathewayi WAL-18680]|uniref:Uncharacterized protein n=2 Tax=Hungatella hathewayi TaxID=154046 RepID=G5IFV1_9FIRM|nr:hypothetical protein HMPREF9473_02365 [ [Hungatella hathewayi WAL-18680]